ncbi:MAG: methylated-DNA--[protein]-cysteine S-methyltransferase [Gammaproteobacteria bacterium]|nr:methylated-DNA--[protein]-cysteine S-methyltransferase [Gammaproteobacteria bacterium]
MAKSEERFLGIVPSPIGPIGLSLQSDKLRALEFVSASRALRTPAIASAKKVSRQLVKYFSNPKHIFDLELVLEGTPFQKKVWRELIKIPAGKVTTYGDLAEKLGSSARAVGNACRANPIPIIVPCHRVIARSGLGGYMGKTSGSKFDIKCWLLAHEGH